MKAREKKSSVKMVILFGIMLIMLVLTVAYSTKLQVDNNRIAKENANLQGEIDTLKIKVKTANNIENIESVAIGKLGMIYPDEGSCVYLTNLDKPKGNFAMALKTQAYN